MKDWYALLSVALVVVVGTSAGLSGTAAFLLAFLITWYLLTARQIGFAAARDRLGFRFEPPVWKPSNWQWIDVLFEDDDTFITAVTTALIVVAASLMFWRDGSYIVAVLMAAFFVSEIIREQTDPPRAVRIPDARLTPAPLRIAAASAAGGGTSAATTMAPCAVAIDQPPAQAEESPISAVDLATQTASSAAIPAPPLRIPPRKSARRNHRPAARGRARKPTAKRRSNKAQRPARAPLMPPPSRKAASPIAFKPGKRPPPRPVLRQRQRLRRPMTLVANKGLLSASARR